MSDSRTASGGDECSVCLMPCLFPVRLPCAHEFCFLCVKGFASQSRPRCAICRQSFPSDFVQHPQLVRQNQPAAATAGRQSDSSAQDGDNGKFAWFYEGRQGWWQYDERTSEEIEKGFEAAEKTCEILIAGNMYVVDLENMVQYQKNRLSRRRKIKRDAESCEKLGIAGLRVAMVATAPSSARENPQESDSGVDPTETDTHKSCSAASMADPPSVPLPLEFVSDSSNLNSGAGNSSSNPERGRRFCANPPAVPQRRNLSNPGWIQNRLRRPPVETSADSDN